MPYRDFELNSLQHSLEQTIDDQLEDLSPELYQRFENLLELPATVYEKFARIILQQDEMEPDDAVLVYTGDDVEPSYEADIERFITEMEYLSGHVPEFSDEQKSRFTQIFNSLTADGETPMSNEDVAGAIAVIAKQYDHEIYAASLVPTIDNMRNEEDSFDKTDPGGHLAFVIREVELMDADLGLPPRSPVIPSVPEIETPTLSRKP